MADYWDRSLENIFEQVNPGELYGYDAEFPRTEAQHGRHLFHQGWVESPRITGTYMSKEEREEARERFKDWMSEFDVDIDFPWDDWREWYEDQ